MRTFDELLNFCFDSNSCERKWVNSPSFTFPFDLEGFSLHLQQEILFLEVCVSFHLQRSRLRDGFSIVTSTKKKTWKQNFRLKFTSLDWCHRYRFANLPFTRVRRELNRFSIEFSDSNNFAWNIYFFFTRLRFDFANDIAKEFKCEMRTWMNNTHGKGDKTFVECIHNKVKLPSKFRLVSKEILHLTRINACFHLNVRREREWEWEWFMHELVRIFQCKTNATLLWKYVISADNSRISEYVPHDYVVKYWNWCRLYLVFGCFWFSYYIQTRAHSHFTFIVLIIAIFLLFFCMQKWALNWWQGIQVISKLKISCANNILSWWNYSNNTHKPRVFNIKMFGIKRYG